MLDALKSKVLALIRGRAQLAAPWYCIQRLQRQLCGTVGTSTANLDSLHRCASQQLQRARRKAGKQTGPTGRATIRTASSPPFACPPASGRAPVHSLTPSPGLVALAGHAWVSGKATCDLVERASSAARSPGAPPRRTTILHFAHFQVPCPPALRSRTGRLELERLQWPPSTLTGPFCPPRHWAPRGPPQVAPV